MKCSCYEVEKHGLTIITAHSGCEGTFPNSREHILEAIASGAEMIEVDVRRSGELLYLSHDVSEKPEDCVSLDVWWEYYRRSPIFDFEFGKIISF